MADDNKELGDEKEGQKVTIPAETLERLLKQLDANDARLAKQEEEMQILRESVNPSKLATAENKRKPDELPKAYLKILNGKIVVGWETAKTELLYHPTNSDVPVGEVLKAIYTFIDGTKSGITDQVLFTRCEDRVIVSLLDGKKALQNPELVDLRVRFDELITSDEALRALFVMPKEEIKINRNFINP